MKIPRRHFLQLAATAAAVPALPHFASALDYPTRPPHIVIGFPPGGTLDFITRLIGQRLSERLGQPFVVESRPGASSNIAAGYVLHAAPDGYALLACTSTNAINASLFNHLDFDFSRDITPVASMIRTPAVVVVNPAVPAKTIPEFISYAKANPDKINMGSPGIGTFHHVAGELFMMMTGTQMVHVPYRGEAPALTDLLGGRIQVMFTLLPSSIAHIKAGELRALAVATAQRLDELPDIPTVAESVPGYEASSWQGLVAPKNTPAAIVETLNKDVNAALADPTIKTRIVEQGALLFASSPSDFGRFIAAETEKWGKVIRAADIKAE